MSVPRVLLLVGGSPGGQHAGEVFLQELCQSYPRDSLCRFSVASANCGLVPASLSWLPTAYGPRPYEHGLRRWGKHFARFTNFPVHQFGRWVQVPRLVEQALQFGKKHGVEMVWAVLSSPTIIYMARQVARQLDASLVTTIWDPPERFSMEFVFDAISKRLLLQEFKNVLQTSVRCGVASEGMQDEYKKQYGIESVVLIHGIGAKLRHPPAREAAGDRRFTIGFAGSLYARREWQALLSALSTVGWRIAGRQVVLRVLGSGVRLQAQGTMHIEYLGWRSLEETIDLMSQVDVTYLPYWFDETYSQIVRLCFPNKLTTYLAAGRPVFYHGPRDASPTRFFQRFPVGLCCHSLEAPGIVEGLSRFITDRGFYTRATQAGQEALDEELNFRVFRQRFAALIGIEEAHCPHSWQ